MNTIKKLLIILSIALLITLGFENLAYASDITYSLEAGDAANTVINESIDSKKAEDVDEDALDVHALNIEILDVEGLEAEEHDLNPQALEAEEHDLNLQALEAEDLDLNLQDLVAEELDLNLQDLEAEDLDIDFNAEYIELEEINIEDIDLDKYDIFYDEQDQMFIVKKEPEVIEPEKVEEKKSEEKKVEKKEKKPTYSEKDLRLLASLVYAEAGNQNYNGMLAVANVVINRAKSDVYSHVNTIEKVIYDRKWAVQFSVTVENKKTGKSSLDRALELYDTGKINSKNPEAERKAMKRATKAAKAALEGENNIGEYLCFRMNNKGAASIKKKYEYTILGDHIFYRTK